MRILIALFHVKRETDIMLTLTYIIVIEILAKTQFSNILLNTHYGYTSQQGNKLLQTFEEGIANSAYLKQGQINSHNKI